MSTIDPYRVGSRRLFLVAAVLAWAATASSASSLWPGSLPSGPSLYIVEGYLDRAPRGTKVADRIDVAAHGRRRTLLVTSYGTPGEISLDLYLSRSMAEPFSLRGTDEEVSGVIDAPPGTKIRGTFAAYTDGPPSLLIVDLDLPELR